MSERFKLVPITLFVFLLLFRPSIVPIDTIYQLTAFSLFMLFREARSGRLRVKDWLSRVIGKKYVIAVLLAFAGLIALAFVYNWAFYGLDRATVASFFMAIARFLVTFAVLPINLIWLLIYCKNNKLFVDDVLKVVFYAIVLQLICVIAAYAIPPVKDFFIWLMQANGNWHERWTSNGLADYRMYGFAKSLFDTFGFGLGILSAVPWIIAYRLKNLKYLLILPVMFFAVFINARTGIVIMSVTTAVFLGFFIANWQRFSGSAKKIAKQNKYALLALFLLLFVSVLGIKNFMDRGGYLSRAIWRDIRAYVSYVISGGASATIARTQASKNFSKAFWTTPEDPVQLFVGAGQSVYGNDSVQDFSSDVGYINNIWLFGVIGTIMLHLMMMYALWKYRPAGAYGAMFAIVSIVSILLFQIKGSAFWSANLGISSILLVYFIGHYERLLGGERLRG